MKQTLTLSAAYMEEPIIIRGYNTFDHYLPESLNISKQLQQEIQNWDDIYQNTLDRDYPPDSSFISKAEEDKHVKQGYIIAEKLEKELGSIYRVIYIPIGEAIDSSEVTQ